MITRCGRIATILALCLLVAGPPVRSAEPPLVLTPEELGPGESSAVDMGGRRGEGEDARRPTTADEKTRRAFATAYSAAGFSKRQVFETYLPALGPDGILDFLEATYPLCHASAHELGRVIFASLKELGAALEACKSRCTSGCMHGILMEAFSGDGAGSVGAAAHRHVTLADVETRMVLLCSETGEMAKKYRPGNCAHGMGHALAVVASHDVERALKGCAAFTNPGLEYYCATGVFMEYVETALGGQTERRSLHEPCDKHTRFPAACYRYVIRTMFAALKGDVSAVAVECLRLPRARRLGCFHGLGSAATRAIAGQPASLATVCRDGNSDDQALCIEGAIEKLAGYSESRALRACESVTGKNREICEAAARGAMYRIDKPTMALYYAP